MFALDLKLHWIDNMYIEFYTIMKIT